MQWMFVCFYVCLFILVANESLSQAHTATNALWFIVRSRLKPNEANTPRIPYVHTYRCEIKTKRSLCSPFLSSKSLSLYVYTNLSHSHTQTNTLMNIAVNVGNLKFTCKQKEVKEEKEEVVEITKEATTTMWLLHPYKFTAKVQLFFTFEYLNVCYRMNNNVFNGVHFVYAIQ